MENCPLPKLNLTQVEGIVKAQAGELVEKFIDPLLVQKIKDFVETLGLNFSEIAKQADMFILFKMPDGARLIEFVQGCSFSFLGMDEVGYIDFLNSIGITL